MVDVHPSQCSLCTVIYAADNMPVTFKCGHTICTLCSESVKRCPTCQGAIAIAPPIHFLSFMCGGCGQHYTHHVFNNIRMNQVHILPCGHRRMCNHTASHCKLCLAASRVKCIDISATAMVCGDLVRPPDLPHKQRSCRAESCLSRLRRAFCKRKRRTPAPDRCT